MRERLRRGVRRVLAMMLAALLPAAACAEKNALPALPVLNAAFSLLEPGNPFLSRYNEITGESVQARMPLGVPYLWGGRAASHLFAKEPDYIVQPAWQNSPSYYRVGTKYIYGFDCYGFIAWVWEQAFGRQLASMSELFADRETQVFHSGGKEIPAFPELSRALEPGDLLLMEHPGRHIALYIGTLRMYGFTAEEIPELAERLDDPLVIHCTVNAQISGRFAELIAAGLPKYRVAEVTDGGVCVSLLTPDPGIAPHSVRQQNQDTLYFVLPDGTWLTLLCWVDPVRYCWCRMT